MSILPRGPLAQHELQAGVPGEPGPDPLAAKQLDSDGLRPGLGQGLRCGNGRLKVHVVAPALAVDGHVGLAAVALQHGYFLAERVGQQAGHLLCAIDVVVGVVLLALGLGGLCAGQEPHVEPL